MHPVHEVQKSNDHQLAHELAEEIEMDFQILDSGEIEPGGAAGIEYFSGYLAGKVRNFVTCTSYIQFLVSSHTTDYCHNKKPHVGVDEAENLPEAFGKMIDCRTAVAYFILPMNVSTW